MLLSISQHFHKQSQTFSLIVYVFDYVIYCVFCAVVLFKFSSKFSAFVLNIVCLKFCIILVMARLQLKLAEYTTI